MELAPASCRGSIPSSGSTIWCTGRNPLEPLRKLFVIVDELKQCFLESGQERRGTGRNVRAPLVESRAVRLAGQVVIGDSPVATDTDALGHLTGRTPSALRRGFS